MTPLLAATRRTLHDPKQLALLIALVGALLESAPAAASCAGPPPSVQQALTDAAAVFSGKVVSIKHSIPLSFSASGSRVEFEVDEAWKGVTGNRVVLTSYSTSVDYTFQEGQSYLVYAHRGYPAGNGSTLNANICGRTALLADAAADLRQLGPGVAVLGAGEAQHGPRTGLVWASAGGMLLVLGATVVLCTMRARRSRNAMPAVVGEAILPKHGLRGVRGESTREASHGDGEGPA